jgi:hypothetical protein
MIISSFRWFKAFSHARNNAKLPFSSPFSPKFFIPLGSQMPTNGQQVCDYGQEGSMIRLEERKVLLPVFFAFLLPYKDKSVFFVEF